MKILNSNKLFSKEAILKLNGKVDYMRMYIYDEKENERKNVVSIIKTIISGNCEKFDLISNDKVKYTNGHFFKEI